MGFVPTWLRQVTPLLQKTTLTTAYAVADPGFADREELEVTICKLWWHLGFRIITKAPYGRQCGGRF